MDSATVTGGSTPLAITRDAVLANLLHRLAAAAGVSLEVVADIAGLFRPLIRDRAVLVDPASAGDLAQRRGERRGRVALVSRTALTEDMWRCALALGAERVAVLPADESMVLEWLVEVADVRVATGFVVGVVGGGGGAGASTLAAGLARAAVAAGDEAVLIDLDPLGGGLELLMGCEDLPGLRWPEVVATRGRISPTALRHALPVDDGVAVLSSPRSMIEALPVAGVREAIQAARRAGDLVVMDLPRHRDGAGDAAVDLVDCVLVLATADVRGAAATACQVGSLVSRCDDVRLVVRVARSSVVAADDVAASAGVPLAGTLPTVRGLTRQVSEGLGPPRDGRLGRALRRLHGHLTSTRRGS